MADNFLSSLDSPALSQAYRRAVVRAPPPEFNVEVLPPAKQGANFHYGMRITARTSFNPDFPPDTSSSSSTSSKRIGYVIWRRWEDCLEFQKTLEDEFIEISKRRRKGKPPKDHRNGRPGHNRAASFESLPTGTELGDVPSNVHAFLPKLSKKTTLFKASNTVIFQRGEEFKALVMALFNDNMPSPVLELRSCQPVRDFFAYWRRDKDASSRHGPSKVPFTEAAYGKNPYVDSAYSVNGSMSTLSLISSSTGPGSPPARSGVSPALTAFTRPGGARQSVASNGPLSPPLPSNRPMSPKMAADGPPPVRPINRPSPLTVNTISASPLAPLASSSQPSLVAVSRSNSARRPLQQPSEPVNRPPASARFPSPQDPFYDPRAQAPDPAGRSDPLLLRPLRKPSNGTLNDPQYDTGRGSPQPFWQPPDTRSETRSPPYGMPPPLPEGNWNPGRQHFPPPLTPPSSNIPPTPTTATRRQFSPRTQLSPNDAWDEQNYPPRSAGYGQQPSFGQIQQQIIDASPLPPPAMGRPSTATTAQTTTRPLQIVRPSTAQTPRSHGFEMHHELDVIEEQLSPRTPRAGDVRGPPRGFAPQQPQPGLRAPSPQSMLPQFSPTVEPPDQYHDDDLDIHHVYDEDAHQEYADLLYEELKKPRAPPLSTNLLAAPSNAGHNNRHSAESAYSFDSFITGEDEHPMHYRDLSRYSTAAESVLSMDGPSIMPPPPRPPRSALRTSTGAPSSDRDSSPRSSTLQNGDTPSTPRDEVLHAQVHVRQQSEDDLLDSYFQSSPQEPTFAAAMRQSVGGPHHPHHDRPSPSRGREMSQLPQPKFGHRHGGQFHLPALRSAGPPAETASFADPPMSPTSGPDSIPIKVTYLPTDCIIAFRAPRNLTLAGIRHKLAAKFFETDGVTLDPSTGPRSFILRWVPPIGWGQPGETQRSPTSRNRSGSVASMSSTDGSLATIVSTDEDWDIAVQACEGKKMHLRIIL